MHYFCSVWFNQSIVYEKIIFQFPIQGSMLKLYHLGSTQKKKQHFVKDHARNIPAKFAVKLFVGFRSE
jgi:hypothetical protein